MVHQIRNSAGRYCYRGWHRELSGCRVMGLFNRGNRTDEGLTKLIQAPPEPKKVAYLSVALRRQYYTVNLYAADLKEAGVANPDNVSIRDFVNFMNSAHV